MTSRACIELTPGRVPGEEGGWIQAKEERIVGVADDEILVRDESFVKYDRLLNKAEKEGRIDGPHKCLTCGMRYLTKEEAEDCCKINP